MTPEIDRPIDGRPERENPRQTMRFGICYGSEVVTNEDVANLGFTMRGKKATAEAITERYGIDRRYRPNETETIPYMALEAAKRALGDERDIDVVIVSSSYETDVNLAQYVSEQLGLNPNVTLDVHAACSGFVHSLNFMAYPEKFAGKETPYNKYDFKGKRVLAIQAEDYSKSLMKKEEIAGQDTSTNPEIADFLTFSTGAAAEVFTFGPGGHIEVLAGEEEYMPSDVIKMPIAENEFVEPFIMHHVPDSDETHRFFQNGIAVMRSVARHVVALHRKVKNAAINAGLIPEETEEKTVTHQPSKPSLDALEKSLGREIIRYMVDGNFSSASLPIALYHGTESKDINDGDIVSMDQFGAGFVVSSVITRIRLKLENTEEQEEQPAA